jgi:hypothetical protein
MESETLNRLFLKILSLLWQLAQLLASQLAEQLGQLLEQKLQKEKRKLRNQRKKVQVAKAKKENHIANSNSVLKHTEKNISDTKSEEEKPLTPLESTETQVIKGLDTQAKVNPMS